MLYGLKYYGRSVAPTILLLLHTIVIAPHALEAHEQNKMPQCFVRVKDLASLTVSTVSVTANTPRRAKREAAKTCARDVGRG